MTRTERIDLLAGYLVSDETLFAPDEMSMARHVAERIIDFPIHHADVLTAVGVLERHEDPETYMRTFTVNPPNA